jgi:sigma-B regulation protein RsbU (phosphoserine phosphatase)
MNATPAAAASQFRPLLIEKRARLTQSAGSLSAEYLNGLLAEVDAALARIDAGTFGRCETCHDRIEPDRLLANPMTRFCLDHLTGEERRAHEQDLELASRIQSRLLPRGNVALEHWDLHYRYEPAGPVGGDYCEFHILGDDRSVFFAVGDVAGKGVAASLLMTHLNAILRSLLSLELPLVELMQRANRLFCDSTMTSHYATLVCGRATADGVELCNAGHCPPLLLQRQGMRKLDFAGLPLGLFASVEYPVAKIQLAEHETLVLYSDGVTEAQDPEGNQFGEERFTHSLRRHIEGDLEGITQRVLQEVAAFRRGARPSDDLTLLALRRRC